MKNIESFLLVIETAMMLTNMSEIMSKKISVLDISIDNFTAKEAMQEALAYMNLTVSVN